MLAGVAGGLAEIWDADPSLVRVGWALLAILTGGVALIVYIVMAIVVPEEPFGAWANLSAVGWKLVRSKGCTESSNIGQR